MAVAPPTSLSKTIPTVSIHPFEYYLKEFDDVYVLGVIFLPGCPACEQFKPHWKILEDQYRGHPQVRTMVIVASPENPIQSIPPGLRYAGWFPTIFATSQKDLDTSLSIPNGLWADVYMAIRKMHVSDATPAKSPSPPPTYELVQMEVLEIDYPEMTADGIRRWFESHGASSLQQPEKPRRDLSRTPSKIRVARHYLGSHKTRSRPPASSAPPVAAAPVHSSSSWENTTFPLCRQFVRDSSTGLVVQSKLLNARRRFEPVEFCAQPLPSSPPAAAT